MKLIPYNVDNVPGKHAYSLTKNLELLEEFANSDFDCVEVTDFTQKNATTCATSLNTSIKRYRMFSIKAIQRGDRVFLIRRI